MKNLLLKVINSLLIVLAIPLSANYCTSCGKEEKPTYLTSEEFKSYVVFPKGSYWVYKEKNTNAIDSIYLLQSGLYVPNDKRISYNYELLGTQLYSSYNKDTLIGSGGTERISYDYEAGINDYAETVKSKIFVINFLFFTGDKVKVGYIYKPANGIQITYRAFLDTLTLNSDKFYKVKVFENTFLSYQTQPRLIYYAKDVGVIKKELFNGQVWELVRYKINK